MSKEAKQATHRIKHALSPGRWYPTERVTAIIDSEYAALRAQVRELETIIENLQDKQDKQDEAGE